ncbi:glycosyltransferase family 4 protein [Alteromonas sp. RKMC-009]|uniref:glycosyltransferase family 4 protein n=1 Tax=Alteromonas sp. RKMC-009 TaxID=2267264 RepID=UPI000E688F4C|nr:glycosyltransferase family 4 protein [Alteromonas sp. RKMC-009]AYA62826.1 glycosyltransferase family 4 protein [Alteromonas sp. RKMC-009]
MKSKRIAIVHDWLIDNGGAEKVLKSILEIYPQSDIFTLVHSDKFNDEYINSKNIKTSFINKLPLARKKYRSYLPLFPLAVEQFDLSDYDVIISSSYCVAKGVITGPRQLHVCYCHSPVRYAWDLQYQYLKESNLLSGIKSYVARYFLSKLRIWDVISSNRVDFYLSNSNFIQRRIKKCYRRNAETIYPPVETSAFELSEIKKDYYFSCSRLVQYKKIKLIVQAFNLMPNKKLIVAGTGPEFDDIAKIAKENITMLGYVQFDELKVLMAEAKCFVFAAEEDFGIIPVEAQACGTPVVAYGKGGSLETVIDGKTGLHFQHQTTESICNAIEKFEKLTFNPKDIREHALTFDDSIFKQKIMNFISSRVDENQ